MSKRSFIQLLVSCSALVLSFCTLWPGQNTLPAARILVIGNSYTFSNRGIDNELQGLAPSASIARLAKPGYSRELGATVAPVGLAFARSRIERPDLVLYSSDGHPTSQGSYLAACVLYGVIFGESPLGNSYRGGQGNMDDARHLQRVASETLGY